ncbi:DUF2793 domain-containing protein [Mesorhizobium sp. 10.2.3]|uniref:DUF2793 domain-containing protein n=1 Tax=Mesorhizobium sp. 10.2.3 TaxID=1085775 RepID=UPI0010A95551|nr:DUF2793 domain-containing protein [Mesorhizobium sp. 10.2.3]
MTTSNRLGITEMAETQNNRSVTVNAAIAALEAGAMCFPAVSIGDTAPPGSPAEGDLYVLGASPTGAWSGQGKHVAVYYNAAWFFLPPIEGAFAYAQDDNAYYFYNGSAWALFSGGGGSGDVVGPAGAVNNNIALFDLATGKIIKDSGVALSTDGTLASNSNSKVPVEQAVKTYVDGLALNLGKRGRVRVATTANITISTALNNGDTLDGVTLATADLVLVKNQSAPEQNGIYVVGVSPARSSEFDTYDEHPGSLIAVEEGTAAADTLWLCTSNAGGTLNTTAIAFSQVNIAAVTALKSDATANLTAGFTATANNAGTKSSGTFTPDPANGNLQRYVNGGAHTLAPPSVGGGDAMSMAIQCTNNGSAGTITTSGFTKKTGDALTTTNGDDFMFHITVINGFSHLNVVALQ